MPHLQIGGDRIYYEWRGEHIPERESVVFLHHGLGAVGSWRDMPERIGGALGLNALAYDRLGYGRSDPRPEFPLGFMEAEVPVLTDILDQLAVPRAHLVGHSDGATISLLMAGRFPLRIASLVVEAGHAFVEPETQTGIRALLAERAAGKIPGWFERLHGERAHDLLGAWGEVWLSEAHAKWQIEDWLGYVECPTFVIQGDSDEYGTEAQVHSILNRVAGANCWILPDCGHSPHAHDPEGFLVRVTDHIRPHLGGA